VCVCVCVIKENTEALVVVTGIHVEINGDKSISDPPFVSEISMQEESQYGDR
jgi:hypothetical protein